MQLEEAVEPEPEPEPAEPGSSAPEAAAPESTASEPESAASGPELEDEDDPIALGLVTYPEATAVQQERSRLELQERLSAYLRKDRARIIVTDNLRTMLSIKRGQGVLTFRLHHMFVGAPAVILRAVARYAEIHDREAADLLRAYTDENEALIRRREQPRAITLDVEGRYHNLQEIFDELNEHYFDGGIEARITWGKRGRRQRSRETITLGQYVYDDVLIRIHPVLDAEDVPRYFVAWIVYHEMLHEVHGPAGVNGRRVYHPPEFRRDEQKFERYMDAVLWERTHFRKLLER